MLGKIFGTEGSFTAVMSKVADIVLVSALWVICSLPVVTFATSTSALYYAVVKGIRKERGTPTKEFMNFFKTNWKQGVVISLLYEVLAALVVFNYIAVTKMERASWLYSIYKVESLWVVAMFIFLTIYLFPVFSRFEYTGVECVKVSILMAIRHTLSSLVMLVVLVASVMLVMRFGILIFFIPGVLASLCSLRIEKIFRKYMKKPESDEIIPWFWDD